MARATGDWGGGALWDSAGGRCREPIGVLQSDSYRHSPGLFTHGAPTPEASGGGGDRGRRQQCPSRVLSADREPRGVVGRR
jgi:hypothetical protein